MLKGQQLQQTMAKAHILGRRAYSEGKLLRDNPPSHVIPFIFSMAIGLGDKAKRNPQ